MNRTVNQRRAGTLLSYLQMTLRILIGLVYTPFMIRMMGQNEYGLYQTATSTVAMLSVLSLGFGGSYIRYYTRYRQEGDQASIRKLNGLYLLVFSIMGAVALACGLLLSFHPDVIFDEGLTASEYETARVLMLLLTVSTALSFPATVCTGIISAEQRFVFLKLLGMIRTVLPPLVSVPFLLLGFRSVGLVAVSVILSLLTDLLYLYYVLRVLKHRFTLRGFERGLFKSLFSFTVFIAINLIVDQINQNLDKFLLARYRGTADVAVYSVGATLYQYYVLFSTAVSGVFTPQVHGLVADTADDLDGQRRVLTQLFTKVGRIQFLILGLLATGVIFFGQPFIRLWAGDAYGEAYYVALLLILPSTVALVQNLGIEIQRAQNRHQFRSVAYLLMALVNLGLTVILCQSHGAVGAAVGTAVSLLVANGLIMNIYYHKKCRIDVIAFWKSILRLSVGLIPPVLVGILWHICFEIRTAWGLLVSIAIYTAVYALSMWLIGMNRFEKELITKPIKRIVKHDSFTR